METFSQIQNLCQGIEIYSSLLTGAPIANRHHRGAIRALLCKSKKCLPLGARHDLQNRASGAK